MAKKKEKKVMIKEAELTNNCPKCFSNEDLTLYFYQQIKSHPFYVKITDKVTSDMVCKKCKSTIYPVDWTDDIERVYSYFDKTVIPVKSSLKFTSTFYIIILIFIILLAAGITLAIYKNFI